MVKLAHARSGDKGDTANVDYSAAREFYAARPEVRPAAESISKASAKARSSARAAEPRPEQILLQESWARRHALYDDRAQGKTFRRAIRMEIEVPTKRRANELMRERNGTRPKLALQMRVSKKSPRSGLHSQLSVGGSALSSPSHRVRAMKSSIIRAAVCRGEDGWWCIVVGFRPLWNIIQDTSEEITKRSTK